jgi:DNA-binding CsgD family transcriptional regulator
MENLIEKQQLSYLYLTQQKTSQEIANELQITKNAV